MNTSSAASHGHGHGDGMTFSHFVSTYVFSKDHKMIGLQFLFTTLLWFIVGGLLALGIRWQLAYPWSDMPVIGGRLFSAEGGQISPEFYTTLFTMHATVMIFFVIIPILAGAFGNYLIPLMIGADDMAFPTLNMLSYWFMWPAFICIGISFLTPPYGAGGGLDQLSSVVRCTCRGAWKSDGSDLVAFRSDAGRDLVHDGIGKLHDDDHSDAGSGTLYVPFTTDNLGDVHYGRTAGFCFTCFDSWWIYADSRPNVGDWILSPGRSDCQ